VLVLWWHKQCIQVQSGGGGYFLTPKTNE